MYLGDASPPVLLTHGQLAVELATSFNGEVINCDALQLYEGLPIITNKITKEEQKGVTHHLLGSIGLDRQPWTVADFVPKALDKVRLN
jgi:tRNA dimethylallyltransferase